MNKRKDPSSPLSALRVPVIGLLIGAGLLALPATNPPPVAAIGPLPACRLAEIPTFPNDYDSWSTTLVDWLLSVGEDYVPPDLVSVSEAAANRAAARIGPTVWELLGPMPILNRSKTDTATGQSS